MVETEVMSEVLAIPVTIVHQPRARGNTPTYVHASQQAESGQQDLRAQPATQQVDSNA